MKRCPRCRSSMILDYVVEADSVERTWKCLGCGREVLENPERQAEDDRLRARMQPAHP